MVDWAYGAACGLEGLAGGWGAREAGKTAATRCARLSPSPLPAVPLTRCPPSLPQISNIDNTQTLCPQDPKVTADRAFNGFGTNFENSGEPIYGTQFLPRKFKIAVTVPGDNSVDLFTNDIGVVVLCDPASGAVQGYNIVAGGGMGRSHRDEETFPRLADPIGFVGPDDLFHAVKAIVAAQRDYGRRDNRKQARLKYLVQEWGVPKFRCAAGRPAAGPVPPPSFPPCVGGGARCRPSRPPHAPRWLGGTAEGTRTGGLSPCRARLAARLFTRPPSLRTHPSRHTTRPYNSSIQLVLPFIQLGGGAVHGQEVRALPAAAGVGVPRLSGLGRAGAFERRGAC